MVTSKHKDLMNGAISSDPCTPVGFTTEHAFPTFTPPKRRSTIALRRDPMAAASRRLEVNRACAKRFYQRAKSRRENMKAEVASLEAELQRLLDTEAARDSSGIARRLIALNRQLRALQDERKALQGACDAHVRSQELVAVISESERLDSELAEILNPLLPPTEFFPPLK